MTTAELIKDLANQLGVSQKKARSLLNDYTTAISRQLADKNTVILRNFGTFSIKEVAEKKSYLPAKGEWCLIPAHSKVSFKASKRLRDDINGKK
jgi:nucleoid DNA-binding protein